MDTLAGKVAVVTGGAQGLGLGLAEALADEGMHLVLADVNVVALDRAVATVAERGTEVLGVETDVGGGFLQSRVANAVEPIEVGRLVARAITMRRFYINTHAETLDWCRERHQRMVADADALGLLR
jgi:NAD(P)-dependent dehydrogenase (short-subunit alcohol dehydrogenase family)